MAYFCAVPELTTEKVTDSTEVQSTDIGTTGSVTTGISTTEGMIYFRADKYITM